MLIISVIQKLKESIILFYYRILNELSLMQDKLKAWIMSISKSEQYEYICCFLKV